MLTIKSASFIALVLPLVALTGCPNNTAGDHPDPKPDAGDPVPDASAPPIDVNVNVPRNPLGVACSSNADCTSGFCTDGVCCDSACGQTCYSCAQQSALGHCASLTSGQDPDATVACTAPSACFLPASSSVPACKFVDGTACQSPGDCVSGHCLTYYVDADGDGFGSNEAASFCEELNSKPPAGYAAYTGDCCDLDAGANPGFDSSQFLTMPDACGSFDWNCNGVIAQQKTCSTGAVACGQDCTTPFLFSATGTLTLFTEACN
jgi:hypothetical protein